MSIFERPAQSTVLESHYNVLVNRDKRLLDELMERAQRVATHEEEKELTQEEQEKEEEASRIRLERISKETNRRIEETERRRLEIERNGSITSTEVSQEGETTQPQEESPETSSISSTSSVPDLVIEDIEHNAPIQEQGSEHQETEEDEIREEEEDQERERQERRERERHRVDQEINRANQIIIRRAEVEEVPHDEERMRRNRALQWREEGIRNEKRGYQLPRMDQTKRVLVQEGLKELWTKELSPLIESYRPTDPNDEEQWLCFEGAILL